MTAIGTRATKARQEPDDQTVAGEGRFCLSCPGRGPGDTTRTAVAQGRANARRPPEQAVQGAARGV
ncbi:hypothetical protein GCM10027258_79500 [Amycolatopsis stemonae]